MKYSLLVLALSVVAFAGCAKENTDPASKAVNHVSNEIDKTETSAQLKGQWVTACDSKGLLWAAAGIKAERIIYDFESKTGKTSALYSDENCQTQIGEATYTGTATVGVNTAIADTRILDLNYTNVSVKITDENVVKALNTPLVPGCGINDWAPGVARDVTAAAGSASCPIAKPTQAFDIVKTDGATLHFGLVDAGHDKSTQEKRPVALDMENGLSKK